MTDELKANWTFPSEKALDQVKSLEVLDSQLASLRVEETVMESLLDSQGAELKRLRMARRREWLTSLWRRWTQ